jgi:uncharacterized protein YndB with AHSA1/START domain
LWRGNVVAAWFMPAGGEWIERPTMEPRSGSGFVLRMSAGGVQYFIHGTVVDVVPGERMSLDWNWVSSSPVLGTHAGTVVNVEFVPVHGDVDIVITHEGFPSEAVRDAYIRGWRRCLDGMDRLVSRPSETPRAMASMAEPE